MSRKHEISCWQCNEMTSLETRNEFDGCCWACGVEIDLEDYLIEAMDKRDEHYAALSAVTAERDGLAAARMACASEFAPDENGDPDVGSVHANIRALKAERDRLREEMCILRNRIDKFESQSSGITALAEIERLRAEVDGLRKAFMKMRNVAAGYSNCCEFDSANTRRLDREFEAADELFRSSAALAAKEA